MAHEHVEAKSKEKPTIAIYASPKCCSSPQLKMYKGYFNVAWFVRAYSAILSHYRVITTEETLEAIARADPNEKAEFMQNWLVPTAHAVEFVPVGRGFDGQVALAAAIAQRERDDRVERVLMFQDPDDVLEHLPEAHALIRNCGLADVGLHINAGATFWAETEWQQKAKLPENETDALSKRVLVGFGPWRDPYHVRDLHRKLNPSKQTVTFIAHNGDGLAPEEHPKRRISAIVNEFYEVFASERFDPSVGDKNLRRTGTHGTCGAIEQWLGGTAEGMPPALADLRKGELRKLEIERLGHGPAGGDVIIADRIIKRWPLDGRVSVRREGLTHVVIFFINYLHAQPHEADIHVLLRTCLHPARGVHLILNNKTAREWASALKQGVL